MFYMFLVSSWRTSVLFNVEQVVLLYCKASIPNFDILCAYAGYYTFLGLIPEC